MFTKKVKELQEEIKELEKQIEKFKPFMVVEQYQLFHDFDDTGMYPTFPLPPRFRPSFHLRNE
jgi:hypothetical protein